MKQRFKNSAIVLLALSLLVLQFQNCAQSSSDEYEPQDEKTIGEGDQQESIINPITTGSLQFVEKIIQFDEAEDMVVAYGVCSAEQQGSLISWKLYDEDENELERGRSLCDLGAFEISFEGAQTLHCGSEQVLKAFLGAKSKSEVSLMKVCASL